MRKIRARRFRRNSENNKVRSCGNERSCRGAFFQFSPENFYIIILSTPLCLSRPLSASPGNTRTLQLLKQSANERGAVFSNLETDFSRSTRCAPCRYLAPSVTDSPKSFGIAAGKLRRDSGHIFKSFLGTLFLLNGGAASASTRHWRR